MIYRSTADIDPSMPYLLCCGVCLCARACVCTAAAAVVYIRVEHNILLLYLEVNTKSSLLPSWQYCGRFFAAFAPAAVCTLLVVLRIIFWSLRSAQHYKRTRQEDEMLKRCKIILPVLFSAGTAGVLLHDAIFSAAATSKPVKSFFHSLA